MSATARRRAEVNGAAALVTRLRRADVTVGASLVGTAFAVSRHTAAPVGAVLCAVIALVLHLIVEGAADGVPALRRRGTELLGGAAVGIGVTWVTAAVQSGGSPSGFWWAAGPLALMVAALLLTTRSRGPGAVAELRLLLIASAALVTAGLATGGLPITCLVSVMPVLGMLQLVWRAPAARDARGWERASESCRQLVEFLCLCLIVGLGLAGIL